MYFYFLIYTLFFWIQYEIKNVAILHDTRYAPPAAGSLISKAGQHELVEANLPNLGSCATPVVPELGGKGRRKTPLAQVVVGPVSIRAQPRPRY
jgi:hypothetical protein